MLGRIKTLWAKWRPLLGFKGSADYWQQRYRRGGDSGAGSGGTVAALKADVLNAFVAKYAVASVVEFGCGDGRQLAMAKYPRYLGLDISPEAVELCHQRFAGDHTKEFGLVDEHLDVSADLALSLDVIFHLVEDDVYARYIARLFDSAERFVIIFSSDEEEPKRTLAHVRHRPVSRDIAARFPGFEPFDPGLSMETAIRDSHGFPMGFLFYRRTGVPT